MNIDNNLLRYQKCILLSISLEKKLTNVLEREKRSGVRLTIFGKNAPFGVKFSGKITFCVGIESNSDRGKIELERRDQNIPNFSMFMYSEKKLI